MSVDAIEYYVSIEVVRLHPIRTRNGRILIFDVLGYFSEESGYSGRREQREL